MPGISKILRRALSYANEYDYVRDHIQVPEGDVAFWRYYDLENALRQIDTWSAYLSGDELDRISREVSDQAQTALRIVEEYRTWGTQHEPYTETQRNAFESLWTLHGLAPDAFPKEIVKLTDQEIKEIGTKQLFSTMNSAQRLIVYAKLAEYDPRRFRMIFGAEFTSEELDKKRRSYEVRDRQEPLKVPMWAPLLKVIEDSMTAGETSIGDQD